MDCSRENQEETTRNREGREAGGIAKRLDVEELSTIVVDAAFHLHCDLDRGFLNPSTKRFWRGYCEIEACPLRASNRSR